MRWCGVGGWWREYGPGWDCGCGGGGGSIGPNPWAAAAAAAAATAAAEYILGNDGFEFEIPFQNIIKYNLLIFFFINETT